jgi:hypothetical protein
VNFIYDSEGKIVFVGNIQEAPKFIQELFRKKVLFAGSALVSVGKPWHLVLHQPRPTNELLAKVMIKAGISKAVGIKPTENHDLFYQECELEMEKLNKRIRREGH